MLKQVLKGIMHYLGRCLWKFLSIAIEWEDACGCFLVLLLKERSLRTSHPAYGAEGGNVVCPVG